MAEQMLNGVPVSSLQQWLKENPRDGRAPQLRDKLRAAGIEIPEPPVADPLYGKAVLQGAILDPVEKAGQIAEHLPDWLGGGLARRAGTAIMSTPYVGDYLRQERQAGEQSPVARSIGNVLPWFLVPGGETMAGDVATGAAAGALQPQDPKDPNYWRNLLYQGGTGGVLGGTVGQVGRNIAGTTQAQRTYQAAQAAANRFHAQTPERASLQMYQRVFREIGRPQDAPTEITPETATQVRSHIGGYLNSIYANMRFNPGDPGWQTLTRSTYQTIRRGLTNQAMRDRWDREFRSADLGPVLNAARNAMPISGESLNQIISGLGSRASEFGATSTTDTPDGDQWRIMAEGMRRLRAAITQQIDNANPVEGARRRAASRAYHLADTMHEATRASSPAATPQKIIDTWEKKVGKVQYARPRFGSAKDMLQREHATQEAGPVQLEAPATPPPSRAGRSVLHAAVDAAAIEAAHKLGLPFPWGIGFATGTALSEGGRALARTQAARNAAASLARRPAVAGAVGGQVAPWLRILNPVPEGQPETLDGLTP